jgi:nucleoside-diphosphate-sugar epimerase
MRILLTGATGFIGSHLADFLIESGFDLLLTKRSASNLNKCFSYIDKAKWVDTDDKNWINQAIAFKPEIILHAAWSGVDSTKRDDWDIQLSNVSFMYNLLKIARESSSFRVICLGSQAEYGNFETKVTEIYKVIPVTSYGIIKLANLELLKSFCVDQQIQWYWLRVFSVLGENDNGSWLLPTVIAKLKNDEPIDLTEGNQEYDYIYIQDLNRRILQVVNSENDKSGVYNICTGEGIEIKKLLMLVAKKLSKPVSLLNFGAIPYRTNQTMKMVGDPSKFESVFGTLPRLSVESIIEKLI